MNDNMLFAQQSDIFEDENLADEVATEKYLIFLCDELKFGVSAEQVVEIITSYAVTRLPIVPPFVRGVINLRGLIIPILDIRMRLGKESRDDCPVVVLNVEGTQLGVLVDFVDQMVDIPTESVVPVPVHNAQKLVSGMCSLPDGSGTMMVLDCAQLLHD